MTDKELAGIPKFAGNVSRAKFEPNIIPNFDDRRMVIVKKVEPIAVPSIGSPRGSHAFQGGGQRPTEVVKTKLQPNAVPTFDAAFAISVKRGEPTPVSSTGGAGDWRAFSEVGKELTTDDELSRLRRELQKTREECDVLKRAVAYFVKQQQ